MMKTLFWNMVVLVILVGGQESLSFGQEGLKDGFEARGLAKNPFGLHFPYWGKTRFEGNEVPEVIRLAKDLGVGWLRCDIVWGYVEPFKGTYDWEFTDAVVQGCGGDIDVLFTINTTSSWGTIINGKASQKRRLYSPNIPLDMQAYSNFVFRLVDRYKKNVKHWQIDNEVYGAPTGFWKGTKEEYLQTLKTAFTAIKKADPDARVVAAGLALPRVDFSKKLPSDKKLIRGLEFLDLILTEGKQYFDILDIHLYWKYEQYVNTLQFFTQRMSALKCKKPVWVTEIGGPDITAFFDDEELEIIKSEMDQRTRNNDSKKLEIIRSDEKARVIWFNDQSDARFRLQADEIVKRFVLAFLGGAERVAWHKLKYENEGDRHGKFGKMALIDKNGRPRQGFSAYKLIINRLNNVRFVTKVETDKGVSGFKVTSTDTQAYIFWSERQTEVSLPIEWQYVLVTDLEDKSRIVMAKDGLVRMTVTERPVFVEMIKSHSVG